MHSPCLASVSIKFCFNQADILCTCHTWEGASCLYTRKKPKYLEKKKTKTSWRETRNRSKLKRGFFTYTQRAMCMMARASAARQLHLRCYNVTPGTGQQARIETAADGHLCSNRKMKRKAKSGKRELSVIRNYCFLDFFSSRYATKITARQSSLRA